jgi:hypothetical protein
MSIRPAPAILAVLPVILLAGACVVVREEEDGKTRGTRASAFTPAHDCHATRRMGIRSGRRSASPRHGSASM